MQKFIQQPTSAARMYGMFRSWKLVKDCWTEEHPIVYSDGTVGGSFRSVVSIHLGDLNNTKNGRALPPSLDVYSVSAIRMYCAKPYRIFTLVCKTLEQAEETYNLLVKEMFDNEPSGKNHWRLLN